jgi:hypothetical protein
MYVLIVFARYPPIKINLDCSIRFASIILPMETSLTGSRLPGFYNLSLAERQAVLARLNILTEAELAALSGTAGLSPDQADHMIENGPGALEHFNRGRTGCPIWHGWPFS